MRRAALLFLLIVLAVGAYLLRRPLAAFAVERLVEATLHTPLSYSSRAWEEEGLVFHDVEVGDEWRIRKAALSFSFSIFPLYFEPHLSLEGLQIEEGSPADLSILAILLPKKHHGLKLDIEDGQISSFSFTFASGESREEIGTLAAYDDTREAEEPLLFAHFSAIQDGVAIAWEVAKTSLDRLTGCTGIFEGSGKCVVDSAFHVSECDIQGRADNLFIPEFYGGSISADRLQGEVSFRSDLASWLGGLTGQIDVENGAIAVSSFDWSLVEACGKIVLKSGQEPAATLLGKLIHQGAAYPAELTLQGIAHPDENFWAQADLKFTPETGGRNAVSVSICSSTPGAYILQAEASHLSKDGLQMALDAIALFSPYAGDAVASHVELAGKATAWIENGSISRLSLENLAIVDGFVELPALDFRAFVQKGVASGEWSAGQITEGSLECENGALWIRGHHVDHLQAAAKVRSDVILAAQIRGQWMGIGGVADLQGPWQNPEARIFLRAAPASWVSLFEPASGSDEEMVSIEAVLRKEGEQILGSGTISMGTETLSFGGTMQNIWFRAPAISEKSLEPFLRCLNIPVKVRGVLALSGTFVGTTIDAEMRLVSGLLETEEYALEIPKLEGISFHSEGPAFAAAIPLQGATLRTKSWQVDDVGGKFLWTSGSLKTHRLSGRLGDLPLSGEFSWVSLGEGVWEAKASSHEIAGEIPSNLLCRGGKFAIRPGGMHLRASNAAGKMSVDWSVHTALTGVDFPLSDLFALRNVAADLDYDATAGIFVLSDVKGDAAIGKDIYPFETKSFRMQGGKCEGDFRCAPICSVDVAASGDVFSLTGRFFSVPIDRCVFTRAGDALECRFTAAADILRRQADFFFHSGLSTFDPQFLAPMEGVVALDIRRQKDAWSVRVESEKLIYDGQLLGPCSLNGSRLGDLWNLDTLRLGDLTFKASARQTPPGWEISEWSAQMHGYRASGEAMVEDGFVTLARAHLDGISDYRLQLAKPCRFEFSSCNVYDLSVNIVGKAQIETPLFRYVPAEEYWQSDQTRISFAGVEGNFISRVGKKRSSLQGSFSSGTFPLWEIPITLKEMVVLFEGSTVNVKLGGRCKEAPFQAVGRFDTHDFHGGALIQTPGAKESLSVTCGAQGAIEKIEGAWQGVACHLADGKGKVELIDGRLAAAALPERFSWISEIAGIALEGAWSKTSFQGRILGSHCCLFEKPVEMIQAACQWDETHALLQDVSLADPSGTIEIKQILAEKTGDAWRFSIPLVKGRDIRPSPLKPFLIRSAVFSDIQGTVGDKKSFRGCGLLHFTNADRKEASVFDGPIQMLKDLGLDLDLFTPVLGEVSCQIREGKLLLTELKNAYSEAQRSEFFLGPEPSYIDLGGNMNIHLRMRQSAVLKIGEAFGLIIGGTLEKPRYQLLPASD